MKESLKTAPAPMNAAHATPGPEAPVPADTSPVRDLTGWPLHPSERRDFYHRIRVFPPEVARWRRRMLRTVAADPDRFPHAAGLPESDIQARLDDGISYLRQLARILAALYGTPNLGNKPDPTDELIYIILARHTCEDAHQRAYNFLRKRFRTWDDLLDARARSSRSSSTPAACPARRRRPSARPCAGCARPSADAP
jgi:hypothetical protein